MVTRVGTRPIAALIAAVFVAALFVACGGSSTTTSSPTADDAAQSGSPGNTSSAGDGSQPQNTGQGQGKSQGQGNGSGQDQGEQSRARQKGGGGEVARNIPVAPLKVSGGGSGQFRVKGGDNSIQEFGGEGDESELQAAAEVVHGFFVAQAREEWAKACSYLAKSNIEQLEKLGSQSSQQRNPGCAPVLAAFTRPLPAPAELQLTTVDAGSLRHEGEQGFLIYYGPERVKAAMPLRDEGGTWKVAALSGTTLG